LTAALNRNRDTEQQQKQQQQLQATTTRSAFACRDYISSKEHVFEITVLSGRLTVPMCVCVRLLLSPAPLSPLYPLSHLFPMDSLNTATWPSAFSNFPRLL